MYLLRLAVGADVHRNRRETAGLAHRWISRRDVFADQSARRCQRQRSRSSILVLPRRHSPEAVYSFRIEAPSRCFPHGREIRSELPLFVRALKLLVVDDDFHIRESLCIKLSEGGHTITSAKNGADAMEAVKRTKFDAVITDILMPVTDGLELIGELRRSQPDVRIVAMSGGGRISSIHYLDAAKELGAHAVVTKPFSFSELITALSSVLAA